MTDPHHIRLAQELGFYESTCKTLQAALASVLKITELDSAYYQDMADADLEEEKERVIRRVESTYEPRT